MVRTILNPTILAALAATQSYAAPPNAEQSPLGPGMRAPALKVGGWLKGTPVTGLDKGIAIVEFWATWCLPCREAMPHLSALAKANPGVKIASVSIWETTATPKEIQAFVDKMGGKMDYNVARDAKGFMGKNWMNASRQSGIPASYLIKDGVIQWIGHPMELDKPLAQVLAGTFDLEASKAAFQKEAVANERQEAVTKRLDGIYKLLKQKKGKEAMAEIDRVAATYPEGAGRLSQSRAVALAFVDPERAKRDIDAEMAKKDYFEVAQNTVLFDSRHPVGDYAVEALTKSDGAKDPYICLCIAAYHVNAKNRALALEALDLGDRMYVESKMDFPSVKDALASVRKKALALK